MPNYPNAANTATIPDFPPIGLWPGESKRVWIAETVAAPQASDRIATGSRYDNYPPSVSAEVLFAGNPGAFEIDVQDADTDADVYYQDVPGGQLTAVGANFTGRVELVPVKGKFVRLNLKSLTNAVAVTARIVR